MLKTLTLTAALALSFGAPLLADDAAATAPASADAPANALSIADGFTRATRPGAPVAGGFMLITNTTGHDDRLVGASSSVAGVMQVHEMAMEDGIMKMRELAGGLPIPAGEAVTLKPGGYHVMFMELKEPLVQGTKVDVTLKFEKAGEVSVPLVVLAPDAEGFPGHGG